MITMDDIIREGHPTLRAVANEVPIPPTAEDVELGKEMLQFLKNSQDPVKAEELNLRGGVGLAAPQLDISKRIIAVHVPSVDPEKPENGISTVMYNPKILSHSVQEACLEKAKAAYQSIVKCLDMSFVPRVSLFLILTKKARNIKFV